MEVSDVASPQRHHRLQGGQRIFTLEQATRTLPLVSRIMADVVRQDKRVCLLEEKCQVTQPGASEEATEALRERYLAELDKLEALRDELSEIGCQLKDWRRGIVDFLVFHKGRMMELCWRLGEERIEHWHEVNAGYRARQPIDASLLESPGPMSPTV